MSEETENVIKSFSSWELSILSRDLKELIIEYPDDEQLKADLVDVDKRIESLKLAGKYLGE